MSIETIERPGVTLPPDLRDQLRAQILALNLRLSDQPAFVANWHARIGTFLETTDVLDLAWRGDELVGHYGVRRVDVDGVVVSYIDSFTVAPELQGGGLGNRLAMRSNLRAVLGSRGRDCYHVSRTSNPHVAAGVWQAVLSPEHFYPSFDPERPSSPALVHMATRLAETLWPDKVLVPETGVLIGAYGGDFIPVRMTRHAGVARHFEAHVDRARGDAIVQIVRFAPGMYGRLATYGAEQVMRVVKRSAGRPRP
ncbi:MAG: GNAT family N-acetyltransferase [Alphaproteobacteria bacterium]|nr:GNAT family N-acetyltransferase [Alphaproteobacteria bacterium]